MINIMPLKCPVTSIREIHLASEITDTIQRTRLNDRKQQEVLRRNYDATFLQMLQSKWRRYQELKITNYVIL